MTNSLFQTINKFDDTEYEFLSNFYMNTMIIDHQIYPSAEHYYQASKMRDNSDREQVIKADTPAKAKRLGNILPKIDNWDNIKNDVMLKDLQVKFSDPDLRQKLIDTGESFLEEGNTWGDRYWGTVDGIGQNHLGKLLMKVRKEIL